MRYKQVNSSRQIPLKRRITYFAVIYLAFLLLLVGIEVATRLTMPHVSSLDLFAVTGEQKAQAGNPERSAIFEGDPLLAWRLKPNLDGVYWDFTVVSTNGQHLRADHDFLAKEPGAIRIVCLGDSVTFGYRVPLVFSDHPKNYDPSWLPYPVLLEKQLSAANPDRKIEVVTMAVPGYTSHQGLAWLQHDIDALQPDLLTVSFGWNDVALNDAPDSEAIRTDRYVVGVRWLIDHSQAFAHATKWLRSRKPANSPTRPIKPGPRVSDRDYVDNMLGIVRLARQHGAGVVVIAAPYRDRTSNPNEALLMIRYRESLRSAMKENQIPFLEIRELTDEGVPGNAQYFGELIHPSYIGHRLIASELLKLIASKRMLNNLNIPALAP